MGGDPQIGSKLKVPSSRCRCSERWSLGRTLGLTEASRRAREQTRAKSTKCHEPSRDGKMVDNVAGKKLVDILKPVDQKPRAKLKISLNIASFLFQDSTATLWVYLEAGQTLREKHENPLPSACPLLSHNLPGLQFRKIQGNQSPLRTNGLQELASCQCGKVEQETFKALFENCHFSSGLRWGD